MRRLFALALSALLVFGFAPVAKADVAGLTPCAESAVFSSVQALPPHLKLRLVSRCIAKPFAVKMACLI